MPGRRHTLNVPSNIIGKIAVQYTAYLVSYQFLLDIGQNRPGRKMADCCLELMVLRIDKRVLYRSPSIASVNDQIKVLFRGPLRDLGDIVTHGYQDRFAQHRR